MPVKFTDCQTILVDYETGQDKISGIRLSPYLPRIIEFPDRNQNPISTSRVLGNSVKLINILSGEYEKLPEHVQHLINATLDDLDLLLSSIK